MVENDRLRLELLSESTGELYSSRRLNIVNKSQLSIPRNPTFGKKQFLIVGARSSTMDFRLNGALSHLCHAYLHFDTLLLHKKDELGDYKRLQLKDFMSVLKLGDKATKKRLKELIDHQALIRPDKRIRYFVNPIFIIRRGGSINFEEFDMLLKHDPLIKYCLDEYQFKQFNNWRILKSK